MPRPEKIKLYRKHGKTKYIFEGRGAWRCKKCRSENIVGWRRRMKERLVKEFGGMCSICGYDRHLGSLQFHHLDPSKKKFGLSVKGITRPYEVNLKEAKKCILLCGNCHREVEDGVTQIPKHQGQDSNLR